MRNVYPWFHYTRIGVPSGQKILRLRTSWPWNAGYGLEGRGYLVETPVEGTNGPRTSFSAAFDGCHNSNFNTVSEEGDL